MEKKYKFTGEIKKIETGSRTVTLHRIRALRDFGNVTSGDLGGWIEKEKNLSHYGCAWVADEAVVYGNSVANGDSWIGDNAVVKDHAVVSDNATVDGHATICDKASIGGHATVDAIATVAGNATVCGHTYITDNAIVDGQAMVCGYSIVNCGARVGGNATVRGEASVRDNAMVRERLDVFVVGPIGSRDDFTTFYRDKDNEVTVACGCFNGKLERFLEKVTKTHGNSKHAMVYKAAVELAKLQMQPTEDSKE